MLQVEGVMIEIEEKEVQRKEEEERKHRQCIIEHKQIINKAATEAAERRKKRRKLYMRLYRRNQKKAKTESGNEIASDSGSPRDSSDVVDLVVEEERNTLTVDEVRDFIDGLGGKSRATTDHQGDEEEEDTADIISARNRWKNRPDTWRDAARHFQYYDNVASTIKQFPDELQNLHSYESKRATLYRWKTRLIKEQSLQRQKSADHKAPIFGKDFDQHIYMCMDTRIKAGLTVNDNILRETVLAELQRRNLEHLLKANGGKYTFGSSWCFRFWRRHKLSSRVATTKMRELPDDFDEKLRSYIDIGAKIIAQYNVPPELVVGCDETNVQLVPRAKRTRAKKGTKRIRVIGVGSEKPQITVTLAITESGKVLPCQFIFQGKTTGTLPLRGKQKPPDGCIYNFSTTHWQTVETYKQFIEGIIIPYRLRTVHELGLPADQFMILKHDLHFTHTDDAVKAFMESHFIKPFYVPGKCTDVLQECDTVVNKPFKSGCKDGFTAYLHELFDEHMTKNIGKPMADAVGSFQPSLTVGSLKPILYSFVLCGIDKLTTEDMSRTISHAFAEHGRFREIREIAAALRASQENIVIPNAAYENEIETTQEIDRIGILEDDDLDSASDAPDLSDEDKSSDEDIYAEDEGDDENEQLNVRGLFLKLGLHGKPKAN